MTFGKIYTIYFYFLMREMLQEFWKRFTKVIPIESSSIKVTEEDSSLEHNTPLANAPNGQWRIVVTNKFDTQWTRIRISYCLRNLILHPPHAIVKLYCVANIAGHGRHVDQGYWCLLRTKPVYYCISVTKHWLLYVISFVRCKYKQNKHNIRNK